MEPLTEIRKYKEELAKANELIGRLTDRIHELEDELTRAGHGERTD